MQVTSTRKSIVCIDTRRTVINIARARKPQEVAKEGHEQFIRNLLKDKMGWPRREPAPQSIKDAAKQMAAYLAQHDKEVAESKARLEAAKAAA